MGKSTIFENPLVDQLLNAIRAHSVERCQHLIALGADVNWRDTSDFHFAGPLSKAVTESTPEIVRLLLDHGADICLPEYDGETPLHRAAAYDNLAACRLLAQAAGDSFSQMLQTQAISGLTPFQLAVKEDCPDVVSFLAIEFGEDPEQKTSRGKTMIALTKKDSASRPVLRSLITDRSLRVTVDSIRDNVKSDTVELGRQGGNKRTGMSPL